MKDLTLDTAILMSASGKSDGQFEVECLTLTKEMLSVADAHILLDDKGLIEQEYKNKIKEQDYGRQWLKQMASKDKVRTLPCCNLPRGVSVELREAHFDPDDVKFVKAAMASDSLRLVAYEDDYAPTICTILKRKLDIVVLHPADAAAYVCDP